MFLCICSVCIWHKTVWAWIRFLISKACQTGFSTPFRNMNYSTVCCQHRGTLCCQDISSCSAIRASHSCGPCHADCLAFSFLGGSTEALPRCTPPARSDRLSLLHSTHLLWQASQNIGSWKTGLSNFLSLILYLFPSPNCFHCLSVSLSLCLSIHQSQLLSQLLHSCVSERWKGCLTVKKILQLCFILHLTECCSCLWWSASSAASHRNPYCTSHKYLSCSTMLLIHMFSDLNMFWSSMGAMTQNKDDSIRNVMAVVGIEALCRRLLKVN